MDTTSILAAIDAEISNLHQAKAILLGTTEDAPIRKVGRPAKSAVVAAVVAKPAKKRRPMSAEGKAKIAAAQKARWAKQRKAAKKSAAAS